MKKLIVAAFSMFVLAGAASAQISGFGWDNQHKEGVVRTKMANFLNLEVGGGFIFNDSLPDITEAQEDNRFNLSISARALIAMHAWEKLTSNLHLGLYYREDNFNNPFTTISAGGVSNVSNRAFGLTFFAGLEPEVVLLPHFAVSTRFGVAMPIRPEFAIGLMGTDVSIVSGFNFRILL